MNNTTLRTPWGQSQIITPVADGLDFVVTAGHGGYHLSRSRAATVRKLVATDWKPWTGSWAWLEEDCDWILAALAWPEFFPDDVCYHLDTELRIYNVVTHLDPAYFDSAPWASIRKRSADFLDSHGEDWRLEGGGSNLDRNDPFRWKFSFRQVNSRDTRVVKLRDYPNQRFYTTAELDALEGEYKQ